MTLHTWVVYFAAALGLALTPGPNSLLVLTHGALHGAGRTAATIAGGALGFLALIGLSMFGIGALLAASAHALMLLKVVGGAYLVWLGIQLWRAPPIHVGDLSAPPVVSALALSRQGLCTAVSNPKALLFYGAFLPQLIDPHLDLKTQFVAMAAMFVSVEIVVEAVLALLAQRVRGLLRRAGRAFNRLCGGVFVAMGAALPLTR